jgi:hypothetical protein
VFRVLADLTTVEPLQSLDQTWLIILIVGQSGFNQSLSDEAYVPQLAAISATHHHAFPSKPHKVPSFLLVAFVGITLRALNVEACDQVHHLGDRAKRLISGVLILIDDEPIRVFQSGIAERRDSALFVCTKDHGNEVEQLAVRRVEIRFGDIISLGRPIDRIVSLGI